MASPNSTFTEIVTTTLRNHPTRVADNVSANNALYMRLKKRGKIRMESDGYEIVAPLSYAETATYQRYSGYDVLNVSASDVLSAAKYDWMQAAVHITASGRELRQNNGDAALVKLMAERTKNAMRTAANNMSIDLYSDGALSNQIGGLATMIQNAGTGTVGGINAATFTIWKNKFTETGTPSKTTIKGDMNLLWLQCCRGADKPDLIVSTHDFFSYYWESLQDLQRYAESDSATAGFQSLKYVTADVIFDSNANFATTGEKMYFLNTEHLELVSHTDANWTVLKEKTSINQDAVVIPLIWMGNLVCSNRSLQGVLFD